MLTPKGTPSSRSPAVLQKAMDLIAGMGSGDVKLKAELKDLKAAAEHNTSVHEAAVAVIAVATKDANTVGRAQDALNRDRAKDERAQAARVAENGRRGNQLNTREASIKTREEAQSATARDRDSGLDHREQAVSAREKAADALDKRLAKSALELGAKQARLEERTTASAAARRQMMELAAKA